ncbi:sigma-70 family RNA polymerase sigma factor [Achromobacter piechaudii]|uniref:ECF RNA polymerase sigma factor SigF n=1 Tax=Achromobacter piechaudii TaxID=72556 RepID=A0ABN7ET73_9BURK|nr:sigma-70 family RNA polymerase sigma factor [Achromobacter piechaudii]CAB3657951.1 ECF RNA polymerase sigma factor SigF [Achromobacter piechaudii]CAB3821811.1 ECF RNA polymerase sigma factor SigF [Achromobacter piechaudii]CAB3945487.1 ECF RNA polymerase sigma factor SigF [Achromobacter piechaudii]
MANDMPREFSARLGTVESELRALWLQAQAGDEGAYRDVLGRIARLLRAYLRRRMGGWQDDVEDLVQECLLALHLQRASYDPAQPLSAWVYAISRHKLIDFWRRNRRYGALNDSIDDIDELLLAGEPEETSSHVDLARLLAVLPDAQRRAIELTKLEGLSVAEAATRSGMTEGAIRVQVHRGLKKLSLLVKVVI